MTVGDAVRRMIAEEMASAPHGSRTATARRLAALYGISVSTVYAAAKRRGTKRGRAPAKPEYREWTRIAVRLAATAPKPMPMDVAIEGGIACGLLPRAAAAMPVATARRIAREMGLAPTTKRTRRMHAEHPMQALQVDGSTSENLVVAEDLGDGDHLLKLHRAPYPASGYKNKPVGPDRLRVLVYAVWDMCTGYALSRYAVGRGEDALGAMEFLCWAMAAKEDRRIVMHGVPTDLWSDQGPLVKSGPARDLLERLDVNVVTGEPYAKERMGGVERGNRTRWSRFERPLFLRADDTIRLSELNARLAEFEIRENAARLSRTPVNGRPASRAAAWVALTNARPADDRLRRLPPDPVETMAREARRKIDVNGIVRWGGVEYECADWHDRCVVARRPMDGGGDLVVEDEATGERRTARRYEPRSYGEARAVPATPRERLLAEEIASDADIYAPDGGDRKVVPFPGRSAPAAPLDDPLDADRYRSVEEAMVAFGRIYPHALSPANRAAVEARLSEAGLSRSAVEALALDLASLKGTA